MCLVRDWLSSTSGSASSRRAWGSRFTSWVCLYHQGVLKSIHQKLTLEKGTVSVPLYLRHYQKVRCAKKAIQSRGSLMRTAVPQLGRNIPYITTFAVFIILALPTALVDNLGGLLVLRFFLGFFGSPCLANGGATIGVRYPRFWYTRVSTK